MRSDHRVMELLGIEVPIVQAPMAGAQDAGLAIAVAQAGGLGSLPCAMLSVEQVRAEVAAIRGATARPFNLNFFCHPEGPRDAAREGAWRRRLDRYYVELGVGEGKPAGAKRSPFDERACELVEELGPAVVSFHFGLPERSLLQRVKRSGARVMSSATTVAEARWLEAEGADVIIAQGFEAGGHRGNFLSDEVGTQVGTFALVPQVVDAVRVPVIAAGGIGDARGVAAAMALGAAAVQLGTAYLYCPEAKISPAFRAALANVRDDSTAVTNVFSGRPARGIVNRLMREVGPMSNEAPAFPFASAAVGPLRAKAEAAGSGDFSPMWAGQGAGACVRGTGAAELTRALGGSPKPGT